MPRYAFQCFECGCRFEKTLPVSQATLEFPCSSCGEQAERVLEEVSFSFDTERSHKGLSLQNTGVSSLDYDWDEIVARDSEEKWEFIQGRLQVKEGVLEENPGHTRLDLLRSPDGEYDVMTSEETECSWRVREIHSAAMAWLSNR